MTEPFTRIFHVGWGDLDSNAHMKNTAYFDKAVDVRMMFFQEQGFAAADLGRLGLGPVVQRDEMEYFRELRLLEPVRITLALAGLSPDAARFRLCNEFFRGDGRLAARLTSLGGWLDLAERRLITPPEALAGALRALARTDDFEDLPAGRQPAA